MRETKMLLQTHRRGFLGIVAKTAAAIGITSILSPSQTLAHNSQIKNSILTSDDDEYDEWFNKIKGKHRVVFDATQPHEVMPFAWPKVFLMTNEMTGTNANDCSVVIVLRHSAIGYAFQDTMWAKYNFVDLFKAGEMGGGFTAKDAATATKTRNPFWNTHAGDFTIPGIGSVEIGINDLMAKGVMICVCSTAITVYSSVAAKMSGQDKEVVKKEWMENMIPGIQQVPSGVWALGRAQEHKCAYIFAG